MHTLLANICGSPWFDTTRAPYLLMDGDFRIRAANDAYLRATAQDRETVLGAFIFDTFPDNPDDPTADGVRNLGRSLEEAMRTAQRRHMWVQRYDVSLRPSGGFVMKYWSPVNTPVLDDLSGRPVGILHHVEDVTPIWAPALGNGDHATPASGNQVGDTTDLVAVARNAELVHRRLGREHAQLREALDSRVLIEQAKGILMALRGCDPDDAFDLLRRAARAGRRLLHAVATDLVRAAQS